MALNNIKIVVVDGGREGSYKYKNTGLKKDENEEKVDYKNTPLYKMLNLKSDLAKKAKKKITPTHFYAMQMGSRIVSQVVKQGANYYLSDIGRRNGDSNYQAVINRELEVMSDCWGGIEGALSGAAAGSAFGVPGLGLVVGLASSMITLGFKYAERNRAYQHEIFKQNNNQAYNLARTSYQGFTGRLR